MFDPQNSTPKRQGISSLFVVLNVLRCRTNKASDILKTNASEKFLWPFSDGGMRAEAINFIARRSNALYTSTIQGTCSHNFLNPLSLSYSFCEVVLFVQTGQYKQECLRTGPGTRSSHHAKAAQRLKQAQQWHCFMGEYETWENT